MSRLGALPRVVALLAALLATACGGEAGNDAPAKALEPEVVDVKTPVDVSPEGDVKAAPRKVSLVGVLPSDFPELPIYLPASVVDFGRAGGKSFVLLQIPHERAAVEQGWRAQLAQKGVQVGGGSVWTLKRGGRQVATAAFARISGGTQIKIEY